MKKLFCLMLGTAGCSGPRPDNIGVNAGRLAPCPKKANCVSSFEAESKYFVEPLNYSGSESEAMAQLVKLVKSLPRTKIVKQDIDYLYVECASRVFGFIDDLEFYFASPHIHIRSASRVGHSDLGVNRRRVEEIRERWKKYLF